MQSESDTVNVLQGIIEREVEKHPHSRALIEAFRPTILKRNLVLEHWPSKETAAFVLDRIRFRNGVPLSEQHPLFQEDDPWEDMIQAMIPAAQEGFPSLRKDLAFFEDALQKRMVVISDTFKAAPGEETITAWAESLAMPAVGVALIFHQIVRIILEKRIRSLTPLLKDTPWEKGYCPICGAFPSLAVIGAKVGERTLHCSRCGHDWRFSRVICPYCEHEGQKGMNFFLIEGSEQETAFTCDQCRRYLLTLHRVSDVNERDLDVSAMGLVHLDVLMQEKGFAPMTFTDWNNMS